MEPVCRGRGIGAALFSRLLVTARNRKIKRLYMSCLSHNRAMQALARKFQAQLVFEAADVLGVLDDAQSGPGAVVDDTHVDAALADGNGFATAILDLQTRWFNLLPRRTTPQG